MNRFGELPVLVSELDKRVFPVLSPKTAGTTSKLDDFQVAGTAFLLSKGGWIATCNHVIKDLASVWVGISEGDFGELHEASVEARNEKYDLAILRVRHEFGRSPELLAPHESIAVGQAIGILGYPLGPMTLATGNTLRANLHVGFVSAIYDEPERGTIMWLDVTTNPGNSGSPVFDPETGVILGMVHGQYQRKIAEEVSLGTQISFASAIGDTFPAIRQLGFKDDVVLSQSSLPIEQDEAIR